MSRVFVSYRHSDPDQQLAAQIANALKTAGHDVFWDSDLRVGQRWADVIEKNLRESRFFVVLVSKESMRSDMVGREVRLAHELSKNSPDPMTLLPVRIAYSGALPGEMGAYLEPVQYTFWTSDRDSDRVTSELLAAIGAGEKLPLTLQESDTTIRRLHEATEKQGAPLPQAELRFETGAVRLGSAFYVARPEDAALLGRVCNPEGDTLIVKGVRQVGKSSLLARAAAAAREGGGQVLHLDFQSLEQGQLKDLDSLLRRIAQEMAKVLRPAIKPQDVWSADDGPKASLSTYLEEAVLLPSTKPLFLLLDEVDRIFEHNSYRDDFFSMVRAWHNRRAASPDHWNRLNLLISHSTEPSLWIQDIYQSPFNVGERFYLRDFTAEQAADLNRKYRSPLSEPELPALLNLLGGHPFLLRQGFYCLARNGWQLPELQRHAGESDGPFGDHLKRCVFGLSRDPKLRDAFKAVLRSGACTDEGHFQRLSSAGLIRGSERGKAAPRCQLYADYFRSHL